MKLNYMESWNKLFAYQYHLRHEFLLLLCDLKKIGK